MAAEISAKIVKELRDKTSAGMMDCKKALQEADGDFAKAEEALKKRKKLTKILEEKRVKSMQGNKRALGNSGGDQSNLVQYSSEVQKLKNAKIKRAKELYKDGYSKSEILRMIINEFKLDRNLESRSWPKLLTEIN